LQRVNTATYPTSATSRVIVQPGTADEVAAVVKFAAAGGHRIYPISQGKNWGFGSKVPVEDCELLIDLSLMNRIIAYDPDFGTVRIETRGHICPAQPIPARPWQPPFSQYDRRVAGRGACLGNVLERGDGAGTVLRACGACLRARSGAGGRRGGEDRFCRYRKLQARRSVRLQRRSRFPRSIFLQSNLGIVTKLTLFLAADPRAFQKLLFRE
jgi:4-cresol dehydrogenase (hydroxylating)